jgi:hypothetical protein
MKKSVILFLGLVLANAANAACPDLSGKWLGTCHISTNNAHIMTYLKPLVQKQQADLLDISQPGAADPTSCSLITINGDALIIGGLRTEAVSMNVDKVGMVSVGVSTGANWATAGEGVVGKASGLIQVPQFGYISFGGTDTLTKKSADELDRVAQVSGDGFSATVTCSYKRQ